VLGGKLGVGPSFTWNVSSAVAREDLSSSFIGISRPPPTLARIHRTSRAGKLILPQLQLEGVNFRAQCPDRHSREVRRLGFPSD
jgi:hypothetical protein